MQLESKAMTKKKVCKSVVALGVIAVSAVLLGVGVYAINKNVKIK